MKGSSLWCSGSWATAVRVVGMARWLGVSKQKTFGRSYLGIEATEIRQLRRLKEKNDRLNKRLDSC